jgi:signal transduction histidine kinase
MRSFIKAPLKAAIGPVNLDKSLKTVLGIFNHEIRKKVQLTYEVNHHLSIIGSDIKLFQLWSNLIKNALEAMEEKTHRQLIIRSIETHNTISIAIANNGEMIEESLRKKIFDKFFSTKLKKSGTGLGLSIVQSILEDHNAHIDLESLPELTTFKITFNTSKDGSN